MTYICTTSTQVEFVFFFLFFVFMLTHEVLIPLRSSWLMHDLYDETVKFNS